MLLSVTVSLPTNPATFVLHMICNTKSVQGANARNTFGKFFP
jgi:hypothetical protein